VRLDQEANINTVLTEDLFQFQLPARKAIIFPISQPQDFSQFFLGRTAILGYEQDDELENRSRPRFPVGREETIER
jgi:hypothetical protein